MPPAILRTVTVRGPLAACRGSLAGGDTATAAFGAGASAAPSNLAANCVAAPPSNSTTMTK